MDSPIPQTLRSLEDLPEARAVPRRAPRAAKEDSKACPKAVAATATAVGALVASAMVVLLLY